MKRSRRKEFESHCGSPDTRAFTLIEIVMAIGLIALLTSVVIINVDSIFNAFEDRPLSVILKQAVREARFQSAKNKEPVHLEFDWESSRLLVKSANNAILGDFPTGYPAEDPLLSITLYQLAPERGIASNSRTGPVRRPVPRVTFDPDRSSTPFEVELKYGLDQSLHRYDPFSDTEIANDETS